MHGRSRKKWSGISNKLDKLIILKFSIYELILDLDPAVIGQLSLYNMKSSVLDLVSSYNYLRISTL